MSGNRVQAVYAYPADGVDHHRRIAPFIRLWAGVVDTVVNDSAAETGGVRHVRFVTEPDCMLDVAKVALSPAGIASLSGTAAELAAQGFDRPDRKYLVWVDAYEFCGLATVKPDDRPSADNANNGDDQPGMVARVDRGCWGGVNPSIEAHELVHLLGGVQASAPNANDNFHCTDNAEVLCYDDDGVLDGLVWAHGRQVPLRSVCNLAHERLLDCGHDDYFHTDPPAGSYLATHWNVASSSFLTSDGPPAVADSAAPRPTRPRPRVVGTVGGGRVPVRLRWSSRDRIRSASGSGRASTDAGGSSCPCLTPPRGRPSSRYGEDTATGSSSMPTTRPETQARPCSGPRSRSGSSTTEAPRSPIAAAGATGTRGWRSERAGSRGFPAPARRAGGRGYWSTAGMRGR